MGAHFLCGKVCEFLDDIGFIGLLLLGLLSVGVNRTTMFARSHPVDLLFSNHVPHTMFVVCCCCFCVVYCSADDVSIVLSSVADLALHFCICKMRIIVLLQHGLCRCLHCRVCPIFVCSSCVFVDAGAGDVW